MEVLDRWIEYDHPGDVQTAASTLFELNKPEEMDFSSGGSASIGVTINDDRKDPYYPSVIVRTQGRIKTLMMNFLKTISPDVDFTYLEASTCSQGATYYKDLDNGKWNRPPDNYCNE